MSSREIKYNEMRDEALLDVVRNILLSVERNGFHGKQHLYITFDTRHPGADISEDLRDEFNEEMTIVLQYEYWDLAVDNCGFSVSLAFEHDDETVYIPFSSIISVIDPSENFELNLTPNFKGFVAEKKSKDSSSPSNVLILDAFRKGH